MTGAQAGPAWNEARAGVEGAVFLAIELDGPADEQGIDGTVVDRLSDLPCAGPAAPIAAAVWLRAGLILPKTSFEAVWRAQPRHRRPVLARAALELQPATAVRVFGADILTDLLRESSETGFHLLVARALTLCHLEGAERCLCAMRPEAQQALGPVLAERAATTDTQRVPEWLDRLPGQARQSALVRFAVGTLRDSSNEAFARVVERLDDAGRGELVAFLEQGLRGVSVAGVVRLARYYDRLPASDVLALALSSALIRNADESPPPADVLNRFAAVLSAGTREALASRRGLDAGRLSPTQRAVRDTLVHGIERKPALKPVPGAAMAGPGTSGRGRPRPRQNALSSRDHDTEKSWPETWDALTERLARIEAPAERARALCRLAHRVPADRLPALAALSRALPPSAWRRQVNTILFARALAMDINPRPVIDGLDRRDMIAALISRRLRNGEINILAHRAWRRLDHADGVALLRQAFDEVAQQRHEAVRRAAAELLCSRIVGLPVALGVIVAIEFVKRFHGDPIVAPRHVLWRLTELQETSLPQREELLRTCAMAFWLRGDQGAGDGCHAQAEACADDATRAAVVRMFRDAPAMHEDVGGLAHLRRSAAALAMLEPGDAAAPQEVVACLSALDGNDRCRLVAHLIVQGQASSVLLAMADDLETVP